MKSKKKRKIDLEQFTPKLGQLITDGEKRRDAIHIAVAPVTASEDMTACDWLKLRPDLGGDMVSLVYDKKDAIGVVDPFLYGQIKKGQRFWMFLFPGTITGLRHVWSHPAFKSAPQKAYAEEWLRGYALRLYPYETDPQKAFETLIENLKEKHIQAWGHDLYGLNDLEDSGTLKEYAEEYLGIKIDWEDYSFSCSC